MAKIVHETITIKFSQIAKNDATASPSVVTMDLLEAVEMMAEQLCGDNVVVEVEQVEPGM